MTHATTHKALPKVNTSFENSPLHLKASTAAHTASSGSGGSILRTIIALVIVIAVIYALTWIMRKLKSKDNPVLAGDGLERVASLPLGTNKSVALVRVGNELHLLGIGDQSVTGIRTFTEDEAVELGLPVTPPGSVVRSRGDGASFAGTLKAVANRDQLGGAFESLRKLTQR